MIIVAGLGLGLWPGPPEGRAESACALEPVFSQAGVPVRRVSGTSALIFEAGLAIDADGAPDAYHPDDLGTDRLKNAGRPGRWRGIVTHNGKPDGRPLVQGPGDPRPGYHVSQTSLFNPDRKRTDPARYVDSNQTPYVALPARFLDLVHLGDFGLVFHRLSGRYSGAIFADVGPDDILGEGSIALARALGVPSCPREGGTEEDTGIVYLLFPGSGNQKPRSLGEIWFESERLFRTFGGWARLAECLD
ncbi:MAG: glycoside hydrolase family 75 protein [Thermodesulfobacteriota bacterium]